MELMENTNGKNSSDSRETLFLIGGAALVAVGAGLLMSTPTVREYLRGVKIGELVGAVIPKDLQRYMRMRSM